MPSYGLLLILNLDSYLKHTVSQNLQLFVLGMVFVNTFIFPILILSVLKFRKVIASFQLNSRKDRIIPFGITSIFYFFTYNVIQKTPIPPIVLSIFLGMTLSVVIAYLVSFRYKLSVHMMGIAGILAALIVLYFQFSSNFFFEIALVSFAWGLIGYSRLKLKKHTPVEIYIGSVIGFVCVFIPTAFGFTI